MSKGKYQDYEGWQVLATIMVPLDLGDQIAVIRAYLWSLCLLPAQWKACPPALVPVSLIITLHIYSSLPINLDHLCSYSIFSTCAGTQALVREGSNESSLSPMTGYDATFIIGRARALVDYTPSPYDKDALKFKVRGFFQGSCSGEVLHVTLLYGYALFCGLD